MEDLVGTAGLRIAVLGGTSPLGKDLSKCGGSRGHRLTVFSRSPKRKERGYSEFSTSNFDLVLNLIGGHKTGISDSEITAVIALDHRIGSECESSDIPYFHLSSGAVFGPLSSPASSAAPFGKDDDLSDYGKLKVELEQRHARARLRGAQISDFRLFSFTGTSFLNQSDYFLSEALRSIRLNRDFEPEGRSFLRDFVGPQEVFEALESAYRSSLWGAFNLYSSEPISREKLLEALVNAFGMKSSQSAKVAASQQVYCAEVDKLLVGYRPRSSLEAIIDSFREALGVAS